MNGAQRSERAATGIVLVIVASLVGVIVQATPGGGDFYTGFTFGAVGWMALLLLGALRSDQ